MSKKKIFILILILLAALFSGWYFFFFKKDAVVEYDRLRVKRGDFILKIEATGTVKPRNRLEIKSPIAGRIESVYIQEGQYAGKGSRLAILSSIERAALLDAAKGQGDSSYKEWEELYKPTPVIAPLYGRIIDRAVEPGQTITTQDVLFVMSDTLMIRAQIDETDISSVKIGLEVEAALDAYPGEKIKARVSHIAFEAILANNVTVYEVDILPDKIPEQMLSGMSATVSIITSKKPNVISIPQTAIQRPANQKKMGRSDGAEIDVQSYVLVGASEPNIDSDKGARKKNRMKTVEEKDLTKREIVTGISDGYQIEIISGLEEGETIFIPKVSNSGQKKNSGSSPFMPARGGRGR